MRVFRRAVRIAPSKSKNRPGKEENQDGSRAVEPKQKPILIIGMACWGLNKKRAVALPNGSAICRPRLTATRLGRVNHLNRTANSETDAELRRARPRQLR